jgi:hypothetical protein
MIAPSQKSQRQLNLKGHPTLIPYQPDLFRDVFLTML